MKISLGIHLGFAINRFPEPEEWSRIASDLGVRYVQFVSGLLQPDFPEDVIENHVAKIRDCVKECGLKCEHTFTTPRSNFMAHPDEGTAGYWLEWLKGFALISKKIGAVSTGSLAGIYSANDLRARNELVFSRVVKGWHELAEYGRGIGLNYLTWEPMSVRREMGETLPEAQRIHDALNSRSAIPVKMAIDVDHGDVASHPDNTDPYSWLRQFGSESLFIHMKQSSADKSGHHPFTPEWNRKGRIFPESVIEALEEGKAKNIILFLELGWREREPHESNVLKELKQSVDYWREWVKD